MLPNFQKTTRIREEGDIMGIIDILNIFGNICTITNFIFVIYKWLKDRD